MPTATNYTVVEQDGTDTGVQRGVFDKDGLNVQIADGVRENGNIVDYRKHLIADLRATNTDEAIFIADKRYVIEEVREVHSVVGGAGADVMVEVTTGTEAPTAGVDQLTAVISLVTTINTVQQPTLITTPTTINPGDRVVLYYTGTLTGLVGQITITLRRLP